MDIDRQSRARARSQQNTIEFLDGELNLCETFLDIADTEFDDKERRTLATEKAQQGYATALAWIGRVRSGYELHRLAEKLDRLQERLQRYAT